MNTRRITTIVLVSALAAGIAAAQSPGNSYRLVENWAQFPAGMTAWGAATGVDVDAQGNVYVFQRNESMPIVAFDRDGKYLRAWGQGMFKTTHFLRVDPSGNVWITDRGDMQAFKFDSRGKLLLTLGKKGITGDNESHDAFNGMADVAVASNGDIFIADGEGPNSRVAKFAPDGTFLQWWGGPARTPASSTSRTASRWIPRTASTWPTAPTTASRSLTRLERSSNSGPTSARPGAYSSRTTASTSSMEPTTTAC